ncbi:regulatory protein RecX [Rhodococcoides corynebacterioides]|uniref:regulatory protein RecX n=1 Tax=Rhodococcoides corynebacterioides TaxID=53972 RepID=UPI001C9B936F|nr:regulatory protein RecX [Rhodococcus corynebacterioides]MBY6349941.1 regulatory protein RecX [Rhodococcus corynebacterioides]MBY6362131.1 regulatory protein RecX [Rhodococcus corynebacterioides]
MTGAGGAPGEGGGTAEQARDAALRLLTDRARSRHELTTRLTDKGFTPSVTASVLDRLTELGLVDDRDFAHQWVRSRHTYSGRGKQALRNELRTKGIDPAVAAEALETIDPEDERDRARELVVKKLRSPSVRATASTDRDKVLRSLVGMLARRGFSQGMAFEVAKSELEAVGADTDGLEN